MNDWNSIEHTSFLWYWRC